MLGIPGNQHKDQYMAIVQGAEAVQFGFEIEPFTPLDVRVMLGASKLLPRSLQPIEERRAHLLARVPKRLSQPEFRQALSTDLDFQALTGPFIWRVNPRIKARAAKPAKGRAKPKEEVQEVAIKNPGHKFRQQFDALVEWGVFRKSGQGSYTLHPRAWTLLATRFAIDSYREGGTPMPSNGNEYEVPWFVRPLPVPSPLLMAPSLEGLPKAERDIVEGAVDAMRPLAGIIGQVLGLGVPPNGNPSPPGQPDFTIIFSGRNDTNLTRIWLKDGDDEIGIRDLQGQQLYKEFLAERMGAIKRILRETGPLYHGLEQEPDPDDDPTPAKRSRSPREPVARVRRRTGKDP